MTPDGFQVTLRRRQSVAILDLRGVVDARAEAALNGAYAQAVQEGAAGVLLNFAEVAYINSTGIALVVGLLSRAREARRDLVAYGLSDHYREIFEITRLADFMGVFPDEASAVAGASSRTGAAGAPARPEAAPTA